MKVQSKAPTPTLPALTGALAYAKSVEASGKNAAVVLVTDGEPNQCGSTVASVSKVAAAAAGSVKTYVVGVGDNLKNLNAIAAAGGTGAAILVSTTDPAKIASDLKAALGSIAAQAMTCDYKIPLPPNGQTIDPQKVNVRRAHQDGRRRDALLQRGLHRQGSALRQRRVALPHPLVPRELQSSDEVAGHEGRGLLRLRREGRHPEVGGQRGAPLGGAQRHMRRNPT